MTTATVDRITHARGVAGEYTYCAFVSYPGEGESVVTFHGSVYGGPVVMVQESGAQTFVSRAVTERLGDKLTEAWVRAFFGEVE